MDKIFDPAKIKALAIDLDGTTLLPNAVLGERTRICLKKLLSRGMQIIISTGRSIESSEKYLSAIGAEGPMVFFNGAEIAVFPSYKIIYSNLIDLDVADFGIDIARSLGVHYMLYLPAGISPETGKEDPKIRWEILMIDKYRPEAEKYQKLTGIVPVVKDLKSINTMPGLKGCIKGMFIADPSFFKEIRQKMTSRFGDRINIIRSSPTFLEITNAGVSKGETLKIVMQHRGLKPEEVIAFGDEENDLSMFEAAGFSAAPENARENIQNAADIVYGSNADEGLAEFLEKMFF